MDVPHAKKDYINVRYGLGDPARFSLCLKMQSHVTNLEFGFMKISGTGYSSEDLETPPSFPLSPLSICLPSSSTDGSDLGWPTVRALSFLNPFGKVLWQHRDWSDVDTADHSDDPGFGQTGDFILPWFIHRYLFPKET